MIGSHIALLGRRGRYSGQQSVWILWIRGIGLLAILYILVVGRIMGFHFQDKAEAINSQIVATKNQSFCDFMRMETAENAAWDDMGSFNIATKLAHWNRDYLAEQSRCTHE